MGSFKHILFTTDLSDGSYTIAVKAKQLAEDLHAKLSLVHVIEHSPMLYGSGEFAVPLDLDVEKSLEEQAHEHLAKQASELNIPEDNRWVLVGSKKDEIVKLVHEISCDLIVVGAHDKHGLALLMGSTADSLLHALPCNVLALTLDDD